MAWRRTAGCCPARGSSSSFTDRGGPDPPLRSAHRVSHVLLDLAPHAGAAAAQGRQTAHHRNDDESGDKAVFDRSRSSLVGAKLAQNQSDSAHATLLWSTSTLQVYLAQS